METTEILLLGLFGIIVWVGVLHAIIKSASRSEFLERQSKMQTELLVEMAKLNGVDSQKIELILNPSLKYNPERKESLDSKN
jgi:hypothetical protein